LCGGDVPTESGGEEDSENDSDADEDDGDAETRDSSDDPSRKDKDKFRRNSLSGRRYSTSSRKQHSRRNSILSRTSRLSSVANRPPSGWGWAIYLNRAVVTEAKGNLKISVGVSVPQRGFTFFAFDPRTHREAYRLITFHDACALSSDKTLEQLEDDLGNMDESVAYDLADDFMGLVEIQNSDDDRLALVLSGEETEQENVMLAHLGEFKAPKFEARSTKKPTIPIQKVTIFVHGAKELERIGSFGTR
jgi:hypothetical protein